MLQKAFPFIFKSGDSCPYQERPRCIRYPKTTWLTHYFAWFSKLPEAQRDPRAQFYIHNRDSRIANRENAQIAVRHSRLDIENLPTRREIVSDREKERNRKEKS